LCTDLTVIWLGRVPNIKFNVAKMLQSMIPIVDSTVSSRLPPLFHCGGAPSCQVTRENNSALITGFVVCKA
jgi:hypothetical protein